MCLNPGKSHSIRAQSSLSSPISPLPLSSGPQSRLSSQPPLPPCHLTVPHRSGRKDTGINNDDRRDATSEPSVTRNLYDIYVKSGVGREEAVAAGPEGGYYEVSGGRVRYRPLSYIDDVSGVRVGGEIETDEALEGAA